MISLSYFMDLLTTLNFTIFSVILRRLVTHPTSSPKILAYIYMSVSFIISLIITNVIKVSPPYQSFILG